MSLSTSDITSALVNTELLSPYASLADIKLDVLCAHANAGNQFSFYGTGTIAVDASGNAYWIAPTSNYKFGDFRGYNRTSTTPSAPATYTHNYPPAGSLTSISSFAVFPQQMNVKFINSSAIRMYYRGYLTTGTPGRIAETSPYWTQLSTITFGSNTPPVGHTRSQTEKIANPYLQTLSNISIPMPTTPNDYLYLDTFFASTGGSRLINLGTSRSGGYTTITMHQQQNPYIIGSGLMPFPWPTGVTYTALYPVVHSTSAACSDTQVAGGSIGTSTINFYFGIHGQRSGTKSVRATSVTIRITYDGSTKDVVLGTVSNSSKTSVSTSLPGGKSWAYDKVAYISCIAATFASIPSETAC